MTSDAARVLVVEDEQNLALGIGENLEAEGYEVEFAHDGETALSRITERPFDLVILDVMMPKLDGWSVCSRARARGSDVPILFLTARSAAAERVRGLEAGGDDYLAKPFQLEELLLRVAAILRRRRWGETSAVGAKSIRFGGNVVDLRNGVGTSWDGTKQELSFKEVVTLRTLADRAGDVVSREELLEIVWGREVLPSTRAVEALVVRLRQRFEPSPDEPHHLLTVPGLGYRLIESER